MFFIREISMAPKTKFTPEEIIMAALEIVRQDGIDALTARSLAKKLGSSAKPIFGIINGMEELKEEVLCSANRMYERFIAEDMAKGDYPPYKASGMAYIRFAHEEKKLFKLLFMRDRTGELIGEDRESIRPMLDAIMTANGISEDDAYLLHLEMWLFVHGIATMAATDYLAWSTEFISLALTDAYSGLAEVYRRRRK